MRILHYFLGFPPYRTGGLTKYAVDLMETQADDGHMVYALWPGEIKIFNKETLIKKRKSIHGINNYELINPLPVPLDEGINAFDCYMKPVKAERYIAFLKKIAPDVIHFHTLMGIHKEFIEAAVQLEIKTVFTTHDYFGICPKVTLYRFGEVCDQDQNCRRCIPCNRKPLSLKKIRILQSPLYRMVKNFKIIKTFRKYHRESFFYDEGQANSQNIDIEEASEKYRELRKYYMGMLEKMDCIHFTSSISEKVYNKYITPRKSVVMTITHKDIDDRKGISDWRGSKILRITCLAPAKPFKGFQTLRKALDEIWDSGKHDFELRVYSPVKTPAPYMRINENGFKPKDLEGIFKETDVLVAPSIWYETFGFTVLEALSFGTPVIVSDRVGAKDIIHDGGIIVEAGNIESLKEALLSMTPKRQKEFRKNIEEHCPIKTWREFAEENYLLYKMK